MPHDQPILEFNPDDPAEADETAPTQFSSAFAPDAPTLANPMSVSPAEGAIERTLLKIGAWPETKTESKRYCRNLRVLGKHCVRIPQIYHRTSELRIVARATFPKGAEAMVEECFNLALTGAVITAVTTGNISGAETTFKAALTGCLTAKSAELARQVKVKLGEEKRAGDWHKV